MRKKPSLLIESAQDCKGLCRVFRKAKKHRLKIADLALAGAFVGVSQIYTAPDIPLDKPIHALIRNMEVFEGPAQKDFGRFVALKYGFENSVFFEPPSKSDNLMLPPATDTVFAARDKDDAIAEPAAGDAGPS